MDACRLCMEKSLFNAGVKVGPFTLALAMQSKPLPWYGDVLCLHGNKFSLVTAADLCGDRNIRNPIAVTAICKCWNDSLPVSLHRNTHSSHYMAVLATRGTREKLLIDPDSIWCSRRHHFLWSTLFCSDHGCWIYYPTVTQCLGR